MRSTAFSLIKRGIKGKLNKKCFISSFNFPTHSLIKNKPLTEN